MASFLLSGDAMGLLWEKSLRVVFFGHGFVLRDGRQRALCNVGSEPFAMSAASPLHCR